MKRILIIGGSKGIGLLLLKKLIVSNLVFATFNKNIINIKNKNLRIFKLDLEDITNIKKFALKLEGVKFDVVLFISSLTPNKSIDKGSKFGNLKKKFFEKFLRINCLGNLILFETFFKSKIFKKNASVVFFSSLAGSIDLRGKLKHNKKGGNLFYRISKSALNCVAKNLAYDFEKKLKIIALHPGYLNVGSGKKDATLNTSRVIHKICRLIFKIKEKDNGKFLDFDKKKLKW